MNTISFEIARVSEKDTRVESEYLDAEFVPASSSIRRQPTNTIVSMPLPKWLDVDRKLHELYHLCDIAIMQRDAARDLSSNEMEKVDSLNGELNTWIAYSEKLEQKLLTAHEDMFHLAQKSMRLSDIADEALNLPVLGRKKRKKILKDRITVIEG